MASSYLLKPQESTVSFDLLFSRDIRSFEKIRVFQDGKSWEHLSPADLYQGFTYRTVIQADGKTALRFELQKGETQVERTVRIHTASGDDPKLLMISNRGDSRSFFEGHFNIKKTAPDAIQEENLYQYPLIVFDGIALKQIEPELSFVLKDIYRRKTASLFFISDSPGFGKKGDNPTVEEILPVELSPRSLRYLPDLGILLLLDISASMMGEKLSLAKVSTLEMIKNLKDSDQVSLLIFWDQYRFLYDFTPKKDINAEVDLSPLIAQGGTDLFQALQAGMERLKEVQLPQKHVIILSDGNTQERDFDELIDAALFEDITFSTLAVGDDINAELLQRLAGKSGGGYYRVTSLEAIPALIFEDRLQISRSSFASDHFEIADSSGTPVGVISGMSLFAPKNVALTMYKNQFDDPLLLFEKRNQEKILMFLSDVYGYYTADLLNHPSVVRTLINVVDTILKESQFILRIAEARGNISFTVSGEGLVAPSLAVYKDNRFVAKKDLSRGGFHTFSASFELAETGEYIAQISSHGVSVSRIPFFFNGSWQGRDIDSVLALQRYRTRVFKSIQAEWVYLVIFFISSLYVTFRARRRGIPGERL